MWEKALATLYPTVVILIAYLFNILYINTIIIGYILYCLYNYINSKTSLTYHKNEINMKIINSCKNLQNANFKPHFFLPSAALQIIFFNYLQKPPMELDIKRESVNKFGVYLDWVHPINGELHLTNNLSNQPILFIIPGLTGSKSEIYILNIAYEGIKNGYIPVIYQNRMLSENIILPEDSHLDFFDDLDESLDLILNKFPKSKIYGVGFSYGANKLVHYLGTRNLNKKRITCGVSVANPFDLLLCQRMLSSTLYDHFILEILKRTLKKTSTYLLKPHNIIKIDLDKAYNAKTVKDFDENIIRRILGYKTADDYYRNISCVHHIDKVNIPLLCVNALDDNITTAKAIPYDEIRLNENVFLLVTDRGGHICWIGNESLFQMKQWVNEPVIEFINSIRDIHL